MQVLWRPVVGFDLDMTLIDSRPGIGAVLTELAARRAVYIDVPAVLERLGPPLDVELANWFPADQVAGAADEFRALYPELAIAATLPLPGARQALAAVRGAGGVSVVITAKYGPNAWLHVHHLGLDVDHVEGWRWGPAKGAALVEHGAQALVGDHTGDMVGARTVGATAVGVTTGGHSVADLRESGADIVLTDLTEFDAWFKGWLTERAADG